MFKRYFSSQIKTSLDQTIKQFAEQIKELKSSNFNVEKLSKLKIDLGHNTSQPLNSLATVALRGNKINIVAFDPKQIKRIQTSLITNLGVSAEQSKSDTQTLSFNAPQQSNKDQIQKVKEVFDNFKNGKSQNSISSIRNKFLTPLKKANMKQSGVSKDEIKKQVAEVESIVKEYTKKMQEMYERSR